MQFVRSARVISAFTLLSRVLGLVRDILTAAVFGAGWVWDAFVVAFTIPNLFRRLLGEGSLSAAFLPVFSEELTRGADDAGPDADEDARRAAGRRRAGAFLGAFGLRLVVVLVLVVLVGEAVCVLGFDLIPPGVRRFLLAEGGDAGFSLLLRLTAVLLPYLVLICLTALLMAALNGLEHFAMPATAPVLLNIIWIATLVGIVVLRIADLERAILLVAGAIVIGGAVQLTANLPPLLRRGVRPTIAGAGPETRDAVRRAQALMVPLLLGLAPTQVNVAVDRIIAEVLVPGSGANSALYYGNRLMHFPLALIGIAFATAGFPALTRHAAAGERDQVRRLGREVLRVTGVLSLGAAAGLTVLAVPTVRTLFEHGRFDAEATRRTALVVLAFGPGILAFNLLQVTTRLYHAVQDVRTPVRIAVWAVVLNVVLNLVLVLPLREAGLALATSITGVVQVALLLVLLPRSVGRLEPMGAGEILRAVLATGVMVAALVGAMAVWPEPAGAVGRGVRLAVLVAGGAVAHLGVLRMLGSDIPGHLLRRLR